MLIIFFCQDVFVEHHILPIWRWVNDPHASSRTSSGSRVIKCSGCCGKIICFPVMLWKQFRALTSILSEPINLSKYNHFSSYIWVAKLKNWEGRLWSAPPLNHPVAEVDVCKFGVHSACKKTANIATNRVLPCFNCLLMYFCYLWRLVMRSSHYNSHWRKPLYSKLNWVSSIVLKKSN